MHDWEVLACNLRVILIIQVLDNTYSHTAPCRATCDLTITVRTHNGRYSNHSTTAITTPPIGMYINILDKRPWALTIIFPGMDRINYRLIVQFKETTFSIDDHYHTC